MLVTDVRMRGARKYEQGGRGGISNYGFLTPRRGVALGECWLGAGDSHLISSDEYKVDHDDLVPVLVLPGRPGETV